MIQTLISSCFSFAYIYIYVLFYRLPEFIRYKIRSDSDKVDSTRYIEDRLVRPGPRRRPGIDLKYLYFGFAYLQVDYIPTILKIIKTSRNIHYCK